MPLKDLVPGLDWDGTVSDDPQGFARLVQHGDRVVIITVNDEITPAVAGDWLSVSPERFEVRICPDERLDDYALWKAEQCLAAGVEVMFDDDPAVVDACLKQGIATIGVREDSERFHRGDVRLGGRAND